MNGLYKILGIGILGGILAFTLKKTEKGMGVLVSSVCGLVILGFGIKLAGDYFGALSGLGEEVSEYASVMIKALGIGLLTKVCADVCRDMGEDSTATKMEIAGRIGILSLGLPVITELVGAVRGML